jgi:murein DD-endopeptidase MepM/ murein hydrolase activator NlpD
MKKIKYILPIFMILCICGLLIASLQMSGTLFGGFQTVGGFGNQGVPPGGGTCANVSQVYSDNPFHGWPAEYQSCNWGVISAYYCTPNYFPGFTHYGIDLTNYWDNSGNAALNSAIHGAAVIATANARVAQAVYSSPAQWNYGMGNFVQLIGLEQTCEEDVQLDINHDNTIGGYCAAVCEEEVNLDLNDDGTIGGYCGEESAWKATYMHLLDVTVAADQIVQAGDVIGHVNNSGNSTGDHLHYQINGPEGAVDPAATFGCPGYDWQSGVDTGQ